jgi:2-iminobutanoate/2-iminopropanoate deaminase
MGSLFFCGEAHMSAPTFFNPDNMAAPVAAYSQCARVEAGSELVFLSGQVGLRPDGSLPDTIGEQAQETFANVVRALEAHGMTLANVVKINTYVVQGQPVAEIRAARVAAMGDAKPASTMVYVPQLVDPKYLIEVEAVFAR